MAKSSEYSSDTSNFPIDRPLCPKCRCSRVYRDGKRKLKDGRIIQRWLCTFCGYRFSKSKVEFNVFTEPFIMSNHPSKLSDFNSWGRFSFKPCLNNSSFLNGENVGSHASSNIPTVRKDLSDTYSHSKNIEGRKTTTQLTQDSSNLNIQALSIKAKPKNAQPKPLNIKQIQSELLNFAWWLKKNGYSEETILSRVKILKTLVNRGADLSNPESVIDTIARQKWSNGRKENAVYAYSSWLKWKGLEWDKPRYKRIFKLPHIPSEKVIDQLISGCSPKVSCFLQLLKETGVRAGEAWNLKWKDIDFEHNVIYVNPEKGSEPRIFHVSHRLLEMIKEQPHIDKEYVFRKPEMKLRHFYENFRRQRKKIAFKLKNPRILNITFHSLRKWKGTIEYHRTKDILHVMKVLGHRNIKNTLVNVQIENEMFKGEKEYICKVAYNLKEAQSLIESGFEYICDYGKVKLFRKPKV